MKIQHQVCTLEQAKRLKELGIDQSSYFYNHPHWNNPKTGSELYDKYGIEFKENSISLYNDAELAIMLPATYVGYPRKDGKWWVIHDENNTCPTCKETIYSCMMGTIRLYRAWASASALIILLEDGKVTAAECNRKLTS